NHLKLKHHHDALDCLSSRLADEVLQLIEAEKKITHLATHDVLTELPNRMLLLDRLQMSTDMAIRTNITISVLFIDLDGFKNVNDQWGHEYGDLVLKESAARLKKCVRKTDTVARFGGDEFVVLLVDVHNKAEISQIVAKMNKALNKPFKRVLAPRRSAQALEFPSSPPMDLRPMT
ncbi:MAG: GGDEF domain-containing protein, partial [Magnetovibrio sp.]|nr:GGDEF domain-containing protein [Magnetovibrio sp.]